MKRLILIAAALSGFVLGAGVLTNENFKSGTGKWQVPPYWSGKLSHSSSEGGLLRLAGSTKKGKTFGRAFGDFKQRRGGYFSDEPLRLTVRARGNGHFEAGLLVYKPGDPRPDYLRGKALTLDGELKDRVFAVTLPRRSLKILPFIEVAGRGFAEVRSIRIESSAAPGESVTTADKLQIVKSADAVREVTFRADPESGGLRFSQLCGVRCEERKIRSGEAVRPADMGPGIWELAASRRGHHALSYVALESPADYDRSDALAWQVRIEKPLRILILGDSLSDFYRGYNYVDRLGFWLEKYNPGKISIRNAAVHGDFIRRVEYRLYDTHRGEKVSFEPDAYKGVFDDRYDLILIFLGQNDTRTHGSQGFRAPITDEATQRDGLEKILAFIRGRSNAGIVLVSPSPSYEQGFRERLAKGANPKKIVIFGKKEFVDAYDRVNREFCKAHGFDYIDILTPMRNVQDLKSLYQPDFVHLSPAGGRFVADEILKYFISRQTR